MKNIIMTIMVFCFLTTVYSQEEKKGLRTFRTEDCGCNAALNKDLKLTINTEQKAYAFMSLINKETYEEIKRDADAGVSIPIFSAIPIVKDIFKASASYSDFLVRRDAFFQQIGYEYNEQKALQELQIITNPVVYPYWAECMNRCASQKIGLYVWKEREDENYIFVTVYYHNPPADVQKKTISSTLFGGKVLDAPANKLFPAAQTILPGGTLPAIIVREKGAEVAATVSLPDAGFSGEPIYSKWLDQAAPIGQIKLVLKRPYQEAVADGVACVKTDFSPSNHNEDCDGSPYCSPDGKYRASRMGARIGADQDHVLVNPRFDKCWGRRGNIITGFQDLEGAYECQFSTVDLLSITNSGKTAEGAVRVWSHSTKWQFCVDKQKLVTKFATDEKEYKPLSGGPINFVVSAGYTEAILNYTIKGVSGFVTLGNTSSDGILRFKNKATVGDDTYYSYDIVVP